MQKNRLAFRSAFTMIELVFVIVILGIVSSIGAELIAKVYENYIVQRALHRSSVKTELVASQIANRLAYSIPRTIIARLDNSTFTSINNAPTKTYNILEWISSDSDSFTAIKNTTTSGRKPGWSGFCDVDDTTNTTKNSISSPGSDFDVANTIITNLSGTNAKSLANTAILFPGTYDENTVGFKGSLSSDIFAGRVNSNSGTTLSLDNNISGVKEHYKLAWSAYAIVPTQVTGADLIERGFKTGDEIYDLALHYNFQPWDGIHYDDGATQKTTLIRNVSVFNFLGTGSTIRFKLCIQENIGGSYPITTCKEKAVIR